MVPRAPASAGRVARAPDLSSLSASPVGEAVEGLGQQLLQVGVAIEENRAGRDLELAELETARGMNELRAQVGQIEDPFAAEDAWSQGVQQLHGAVTGGDAPLIGRRNSDDFELIFGQMRDRHAASLGPSFLLAQVEARRQSLDALGAELGQSWLQGDARLRSEVEGQFGTALARQVVSGLLSERQAAEVENAWLDELSDREIELSMAEDPEPEPEPDPAEIAADHLRRDPELARLADLRGYSGLTLDEVGDFLSVVERLDALPPGERRAALEAETAEARTRRLAAMPKPYRHAGGKIDRPALVASAQALRLAWRRGDLSVAEFNRQAERLRDYEGLLDD